MNNSIPKIIHYCWFGGNPFSDLEKKCIASWKEKMPDYEIVEWNETNFDVQYCNYVKEAYEAKKWAFVSDYARFKILYENGGIYLDTDVELLEPLTDIINRGNYMGCENYTKDEMKVNPGLGCATAAGNPFYKEMLDDYEQSSFLSGDGTANLYTVVERTTKLLTKYGLENSTDIQTINDITIYPAEYFSPKGGVGGEIRITDNTYSIHHYKASWVDKKSIKRGKIYGFIKRIFGENFANKMRRVFGRKNEQRKSD